MSLRIEVLSKANRGEMCSINSQGQINKFYVVLVPNDDEFICITFLPFPWMKEINSNVAIKRSKSFQLLPNLNKNANKKQ